MTNTLTQVVRPARKSKGLPVPPVATFGWRRRALEAGPVAQDNVATATLATLLNLLQEALA